MERATSPDQFLRFLEEDLIVNGPLIYLVKYQDHYKYHVLLDDASNPSSMLFIWHEPGSKEIVVYLEADDDASAKMAVEYIIDNRPLLKWHLIFDERFEPLVRESIFDAAWNWLKMYTLDEKEFVQRSGNVVELDTVDHNDVFDLLQGELVWDTKFMRWMMEQGPHVGIIEDDKLIAWSGTAWKTNGSIEIGVMVRDGHRGKGLGKACVSKASKLVLDMGLIPFYQTTEDNTGSWGVAEALGYSLREKKRIVTQDKIV